MRSQWAFLILVGFIFLALAGGADGQVFNRPARLAPAEIEPLDAASSAQLENAKRFLAERQWAEAVEAIRHVEEADPSRLVQVEMLKKAPGFERYVPASEYAQWRLATLAGEAPEALAHYRRLVDSLADGWFREGAKKKDERLLRRVVEQAFASSAGDDALLTLGDLALARGDYAGARAAWRQIYAANTSAETARLREPAPLSIYPDSDIDQAAVLARLVLASIFEGSKERAQSELGHLRLLYPNASGRIAGRDGRYAGLLPDILEESRNWSPTRESPDWATFGGVTMRGKMANFAADALLRPLWSFPLPRLASDREITGAGQLRPAEDGKSLLSYHPIVVGQTVILRLDAQGKSSVVALDLKTGKRLWHVEQNQVNENSAADDTATEGLRGGRDSHATLARHMGVARFTASAFASKLFVRMGSLVTVPSGRRAAFWLAKDQGFLVGLDWKAEGKPLEGFPIRPPANDWTFEGPPICDGSTTYVVMRRLEGARCQFYLAAFELQTTPAVEADDQDENARPIGRLKWRTRICSSATVGGGEIDELTHLLVTKDHDRLYVNTSAGAVAAVRADDGQLLWLVKYPRVAVGPESPDRSDKHLFRDLTPCLVWNDLVITAPADCDRIFALEGATGQLAWTLPPGAADDAVHLLGVADDTLLASGDSLYWIDALQGRVLSQFPRGKLGGEEQAAPSPRGFGRGVLANHHVWWPTREAIYVFAARPAESDFGWQPRLRREIPLPAPTITGGNLVMASDVLLIAGGDKLVAYGE